MRRYSIVSLLLVAVLGLAACGSSSSGSSKATTPDPSTVQPLSSPSYEKAGPTPSKSAQMVCVGEARADIAKSLGVKDTRVTKPTWTKAEHLYSCTYVYPNGKIGLSVKELSSEKQTTAYFERLLKQYGKKQELIGLGQGGWVLKNGDVVVRKDYKVLHVDASGLPKHFQPLMRPEDVATAVGVTIMGCWVGD